MERYEITISDSKKSIALISLEAPSLLFAVSIIDQLIAHGHAVEGMTDGIDNQQCLEIEGYDSASAKADSAIITMESGDPSIEDDLHIIKAARIYNYAPHLPNPAKP